MDQFRENFREEAFELLDSLEQDLLELESNTENIPVINSIFRALHTLKGSSSMFGMQSVTHFAHELEMMLELIRDGQAGIGRDGINILFQCKDHFHKLITDNADSSADDDCISDELARSLSQAIQSSGSGTGSPSGSNASSGGGPAPLTFQIHFQPSENVFLKGLRPLLLIKELSQLGEMTVVTRDIPPALKHLSDLNPELCYTSWVIFLTTTATLNEIQDVFIFVQGDSELDIIVLDSLTDEQDTRIPIGEILMRQGIVTADDVRQGLEDQKELGKILVEHHAATETDINTALDAQQHINQVLEARKTVQQTSNIRVDARRLDELITLVGELVTVQARVSRIAVDSSDSSVRDVAEELERLVGDIRENAMSIRMLPIGTTFNRYKRLVRDLSRELEKEVRLRTVGGDTELDKTVLDKLNDPLVHIIRNALDHGIEDVETRAANGKPAAGTISLMAEHVGASVHVIIEDDGGGLATELIREKAVTKGLIPENAVLDDDEIHQLIFHPGFSTASALTEVSGRGVGMDVVRKHITDLGGHVRIESRKGEFTRIVLDLPLTLAIIEGMLVQSGNESYVLPLSAVESCLELGDKDQSGGGNVFQYRDHLLPYIRLRDVYDIPGSKPDIEQIVVLNHKNRLYGITVDNVVGSHQTVIKNLGNLSYDLQGITGATILGDGSIALIMDPHELMQLASQGV